MKTSRLAALVVVGIFIASNLNAQTIANPPSLPNRVNLSQAERDLLTAQRGEREVQARLKSSTSSSKNASGFDVKMAAKNVESAENRVKNEQQNYDRATEQYNRDLAAYKNALNAKRKN